MRRRLSRRRVLAAFGLAALALTGCEAEPTPLPVVIPPTVTPTPPPPDALTYAIAPNARGLIPELSQIEANAQVIQLDALPTGDDLPYDLIVALGDQPGWLQSPTAYTVSLIVDTTQPPLDDAAVTDLLRRTIMGSDTNAISLRAELANAGYPDGFDVTFTGSNAPGIDALTARLSTLGIDMTVIPTSPADLTLVTGSSDPARIDLFSEPISYRAAPGVAVEFAPSGFPIFAP